MLKRYSRMVFFIVVILAIALFFIYDLNQYFSFAYIKSEQQKFIDFYVQNRFITIAIFFLLYVLMAALSLPSAAIMTLLAGALFGLVTGLIIVSFASAIGASFAFLVSRFIFKEYINRKFGHVLAVVNDGISKEGAFYLFALRLAPIFPYFLINLVMGITSISLGVFYLVSQLGMLPGTILYIYAGTELAKIDSMQDIASPPLILAFALLGIFPLLAKRFLRFLRVHKLMKRFKKPNFFDYNVVVIGAGSGGLVAAYVASFLKAKVALIEKDKMGGDCLNRGCIPSKAMIRSAQILSYFRRAREFGISKADVDFSFKDIMERIRKVIEKISPHDSRERYEKLGVECIKGKAKIIDPYRIKVDRRVLVTKNIIVATGAKPFVPPIPGLDKIDYLTSDTVWDLEELPKKLAVLGGGPLGCELAQCFARFGSKVTLIERGSEILTREDSEISSLVAKRFKDIGINILTNHTAKEFVIEGDKKYLICKNGNGSDSKIEFVKILIAIGRRANVQGFGLEDIGVELTERNAVKADQFLRTNYSNIYVCGDVTGPYQFTHTASYQAKFAVINALFSPFKKFKANLKIIPWTTFTDPEIARVGLNEKEAKLKNIKHDVTIYSISDLDRAIVDSEDYGLIKVLTANGSDRILGVTIVGHHISDLLSEFILAMQQNIGLNKILNTIHVYPTLSEANRNVAGMWKRKRVTKRMLDLLERFNGWRRG